MMSGSRSMPPLHTSVKSPEGEISARTPSLCSDESSWMSWNFSGSQTPMVMSNDPVHTKPLTAIMQRIFAVCAARGSRMASDWPTVQMRIVPSFEQLQTLLLKLIRLFTRLLWPSHWPTTWCVLTSSCTMGPSVPQQMTLSCRNKHVTTLFRRMRTFTFGFFLCRSLHTQMQPSMSAVQTWSSETTLPRLPATSTCTQSIARTDFPWWSLSCAIFLCVSLA
mmetsp:Transcript_5666/g.21951  ORF Transcript_5666/g.21951 Transcript_5666/m.21951 type:complete len:221 (-) Transcript_5666:873-1535(-)